MILSEQKLSTWNDINKFIQNSSSLAPYDVLYNLLERIDLNSNELHQYQFKISGKIYNANIDASIAKSIVVFQDKLDKIYELCNTKSKIKVTHKQILFTIEEGSSFFKSIDIVKFFQEWLPDFFNNMDSGHKLYVVLFIVLGFCCYRVCKTIENYLNNKHELEMRQIEKDERTQLNKIAFENNTAIAKEAIENNTAIAKKVIKNNNTISELLTNVKNDKKLYQIVKKSLKLGKKVRQSIIDNAQLSEIDSITINGEKLNHDDISKLQTQKTFNMEQEEILSGNFKVLGLDTSNDKNIKIRVKQVDPSQKYMNYIFDLIISIEKKDGVSVNENFDFIFDAIKNNKTIKLSTLVVITESKRIHNGKILSFQ